MIIWFDKYMGMHVDKTASANDSFSLANYMPYTISNENIYFKANAVVDGNTVLFTHAQVTREGGRRAYGCPCASSTGRRTFLQKNLRTMENSIAAHLRREKGYRGKINVRFKIGESTLDMFKNLGYKYVKDADYNYHTYGCKYVIVEKTL